MGPEHINSILGCFKNGTFELISPLIGYFNVSEYILSTKSPPPKNLDTNMPGSYETRNKVFLNIGKFLSQYEHC